jgi:phosphoribosylformylglycinamidine synthase
MIRGDALLFSESQSRVVLSLHEQNLESLRQIASRHNVPMQVIGSVGGNRFVFQPLLQMPVEEIKSIWANALTARLK